MRENVGKMRITSNTDTFYAVSIFQFVMTSVIILNENVQVEADINYIFKFVMSSISYFEWNWSSCGGDKEYLQICNETYFFLNEVVQVEILTQLSS